MTGQPNTRGTLAADLTSLGLRAGETVLAHTSLSALGWVCGGGVAVVQALLDVLGPSGTLVVPTQTMGNSDPSLWTRPPVAKAWWPTIRETMPGFDRRLTPSVGVGVIPELVRTWPGAVRSDHPQASFAAVGPAAESLMAVHRLDSHLGEDSPSPRSSAPTRECCCWVPGMTPARRSTWPSTAHPAPPWSSAPQS